MRGCRAAILLDEPFMFVPELLRFGLQKPLLLVRAEYADQTLYTKNNAGCGLLSVEFDYPWANVVWTITWLSNPGT